MKRLLLQFGSLCAITLCASTAVGDTYEVRVRDDLVDRPVSGRLILFFLTRHDGTWATRAPLDGPFPDDPQPIAAIDVTDLEPGGRVILDGSALAFPTSVNDIDGLIRVQAILDRDDTAGSFRHGSGNLYSPIVTVTVSSDRDEHVSLELGRMIERADPPTISMPNLRWVRLRSQLLSDFYGRDVFHRAGVALPRGYDAPEHADRRWPTIFVIPEHGGGQDSAANYAAMLTQVESEYVPQAVWIVLDPDSPLGHHGFCDSENNGPRATAFVEEFIPHLASQFRLDPRPEARLLYGHAAGGWSALWLQVKYPDTFGGCWSSAPDPVDFTRFQYSNLISDTNLYAFAPGQPTPSYRRVDFDGRDIVRMTVEEEAMMERVIAPRGRSGQRWDRWEAMWSQRDPETGMPRPMFDATTGAIDHDVVERWRRFDIRLKAIREWEQLEPVFRNKVRIVCGEHDAWYFNRAVEQFRQLIDLRFGPDHDTAHVVRLVEHASHGNLTALTTQQMHDAMIAHFEQVDADSSSAD